MEPNFFTTQIVCDLQSLMSFFLIIILFGLLKVMPVLIASARALIELIIQVKGQWRRFAEWSVSGVRIGRRPLVDRCSTVVEEPVVLWA